MLILSVFAMTLFAPAGQDLPRFVLETANARPLDAASMRDYPPTPDAGPGDVVRGFRLDLNGDSRLELIRVYGPSTCGAGGCPYEIVDGKTRKVIADLFGNPIWVFGNRLNGWPVLGVYSHGSSSSGAYETLVFDGNAYVLVSHVGLTGRDVTALFAAFKDAAKIR